MKRESLYFSKDELRSDSQKKIYAAEELTFNVTEDLLIIMEDAKITKSQLASDLGKTKSYISQLLSGSRNMTLRTLSELCYVLDVTPSISLSKSKDSLWELAITEDSTDELQKYEKNTGYSQNISFYNAEKNWDRVAC